MAVTLHALEEATKYTRLRFCACCPLTPGAPGAHVGARARLKSVLSHVGDDERLTRSNKSSGGVRLGRLVVAEGGDENTSFNVPWCVDVTIRRPAARQATTAIADADQHDQQQVNFKADIFLEKQNWISLM